MKVIIATTNQGKVKEIKSKIIGVTPDLQVVSLIDLNFLDEIEETGVTFEQNALIKAQLISASFPDDIVIADDSGLEIAALNNQPGVYSARFAKDSPDHHSAPDRENINKVLRLLANTSERQAVMKTVICLIKPNAVPVFYQGIVTGQILKQRIGTAGFGYDPIFTHDGEQSFAQLSNEEKNLISHRGQALEKLLTDAVWSDGEV